MQSKTARRHFTGQSGHHEKVCKQSRWRGCGEKGTLPCMVGREVGAVTLSGRPFNCRVRSPEGLQPQQLLLPWPRGSGAGEGPALTLRTALHPTAGRPPPHSPCSPASGSRDGRTSATTTYACFPRIRVPGDGRTSGHDHTAPFLHPGTPGQEDFDPRPRTPLHCIRVPGDGRASEDGEDFPRRRTSGALSSSGPAYLLHEHVDVCLRRVQHVAVEGASAP